MAVPYTVENEKYYEDLIDFYKRMTNLGIDDINLVHDLAVELGLSRDPSELGFLWREA